MTTSCLHWGVVAVLVTVTLASPALNLTRADTTRCTLPGLFCLDCKTLGVCVEIQGKFVEYVMDTCPDAEPCSASLKACSNKQSFCTAGGTFRCLQEGLFPDPYDCNVYHVCGASPDPDVDEYKPDATRTCDISTAFNPLTGKCDLPEEHSPCAEGSYPVPICGSSVVTVGVLEQNPNYYWICDNTVPYILKCGEGEIFDTRYFKCVSDGIDPPEQTTTLVPGGFKCVGTGKEPDPSSCYRYYDCSDPENPVYMACLFGKYFHQRKEKCVLGFCPY